jgi:hypothetical protein
MFRPIPYLLALSWEGWRNVGVVPDCMIGQQNQLQPAL